MGNGGVGMRREDPTPPQDELALRRRASAQGGSDREDGDEEPVRFSLVDTFAMIVAAYQILLPAVAAFVAVMFLVYLLFRLIFT